jgi:predicted GIY-YIG superfamily endonuclease
LADENYLKSSRFTRTIKITVRTEGENFSLVIVRTEGENYIQSSLRQLADRTIKYMYKQWKWYVYIIECDDGLYYTGMTWDIHNRIDQHSSGKGSKFTSRHGFKRLCFIEEFTDIYEAREREHQLKDFSRKKKEALFNVP